MKFLRKAHIPLFLFVLVSIIAITTYVKFPSLFTTNEVKTSTTLAVKSEVLQLENQEKLKDNVDIESQKKLEVQNKFKEKQRLEDEKKLEDNVKLEEQKKLEEQQKTKALEEKAKAKTPEEQKKQEEVSKQEETPSKQKSSSKIVTSSSKQTPVVTPTTYKKPELLIDKINGKGSAQQAIVVTANSTSSVSVVITTFEKVNGTWRQVASFPGNIGRNGFTYNKVEGDGHSPIGIFSLGTAFGRYVNPGSAMNYRRSTSNDFWVDDVNSSLYNTWQKGPAGGRWNSAENMYIPAYNYGFVINHNTSSRTPGKGSAIFFHVWSGPGHGTAGCTAAAQSNVINTLKWLNPSKNPVIIEGPMSSVIKM